MGNQQVQIFLVIISLLLAYTEAQGTPPTCENGYEVHGAVCQDIDECAANTANCPTNSYCLNRAPHYECSCKDGFVTYQGTCVEHVACTVDSTSPQCVCPEGHRRNADNMNCEDINECDGIGCGSGDKLVCTNTIGAYECDCEPGYEKTSTGVWGYFSGMFRKAQPEDAVQCSNVNECAAEENPCGSELTICTDTPGSYECACQDSCSMRGEVTNHGTENCKWWAELEQTTCDDVLCGKGTGSGKIQINYRCTVKVQQSDGICGFTHLDSTIADHRDMISERCNVDLPLLSDPENTLKCNSKVECKIENLRVGIVADAKKGVNQGRNAAENSQPGWKPSTETSRLIFTFEATSGSCVFEVQQAEDFELGEPGAIFTQKESETESCNGDLQLLNGQQMLTVTIETNSHDKCLIDFVSGEIKGQQMMFKNVEEWWVYGDAPQESSSEKDVNDNTYKFKKVVLNNA